MHVTLGDPSDNPVQVWFGCQIFLLHFGTYLTGPGPHRIGFIQRVTLYARFFILAANGNFQCQESNRTTPCTYYTYITVDQYVNYVMRCYLQSRLKLYGESLQTTRAYCRVPVRKNEFANTYFRIEAVTFRAMGTFTYVLCQ